MRNRPFSIPGKAMLLFLFLILLMPHEAVAQQINLDFGPSGSGSTTATIVRLILLMTVLTLAPSFLLMVTCFTRLIVVFSVLRNAMGTGTTPPNQVMASLALFMTIFIMQPTLETAWKQGMEPMMNDQIDEFEAFDRSIMPFRLFMVEHTRPKDLQLFMDMANLEPVEGPEQTPLRALIPAFMISELLRAFEIGFLIYLPFIIIDMVIASVLMSMGMMMLPPMMLALPFKLVFFVLVDGWHLLVGSLVQSYGILQ
ncbi:MULTISPECIES: flagellar type III secretion system pore protein FliP [unclassified Haematospirillum]|uniref:flagellar type III secretion system pore protein FliP n=1 Tax=unclassified Haematospirillum TaxID=2622088 RepID=UPI00143B5F2C|nr:MULTISPECIES: flagellar type III secretion system pore protein FliP [unclassified Haematospirillum]NKD55834.1 flagellar type III secretion system pore protein FliP [Haematospirillum sp. H4890]NKD75855.1 flagellar type III secretion system pore protein FliP [Haematospirillum sp. H4485]NKD87967.1 flagellar type III secretion system pore protein FliP [Haematospirillum sp. 15-248]